jgi:hypothetical protein
MPGFDGTGPDGLGPMTGRGMGPCGNNQGRGRGRGMGRGMGRSLRQGYCPFFPNNNAPTPPERIDVLKAYKKELEEEIKALEAEKNEK